MSNALFFLPASSVHILSNSFVISPVISRLIDFLFCGIWDGWRFLKLKQTYAFPLLYLWDLNHPLHSWDWPLDSSALIWRPLLAPLV